MIKKASYNFLIQLIVLGFKKYKILYLLSILSIVSIILEAMAMSLMGSLSGKKFIFFNDYLQTVNGNLIFICVVCFFIIRFIALFYTEASYAHIARQLQVYLSTRTLEKIFNERLKVIEEKEIGFFISMAGDEASRSSEILNSFLRIVNSILVGILYFIMILYFDYNFIYILLAFFVINFFVIRKVIKKLIKLGNESVILGRLASSIFLDSLNSLRTVKSFGMNRFIHDKYYANMNSYQITNYRIFALSLFNKLFPLITLFLLFDIYVVLDYTHHQTLSAVYLLTIFFL